MSAQARNEAGSTPSGRVDLDAIAEQFRRLGLEHAAGALATEISAGVKHNRAPHEVIQRLLAVELTLREQSRIRTSLRLSGLPPDMTLGNFDFGFQPSVDRRQIETLATCSFVRQCATVLLQGPPGVGKTHLAVALGVSAIEHGFSVAFYRLEELLQQMRKDADVPLSRLRRKKYLNVAFLIIDEVGFEPMSRQDASLFFRLISHRYMKGSTAITTNKSVKEWPGIFAGDEAMTAAILDRLLHRCVVLNIRGRSYRLQELDRLLK